MKKKLGCLFMSILLAFGCLAAFGCGGSGKIKIEVGMWPIAGQPKDIEMYNGWKEAFEADHPEYEIVGKPYTYNPDTFSVEAMGGTIPTIFQTYFTEPPILIDKGYIKDITDAVKELGWYDKMDEDMRDSLSRDGRLYGIPRDGYGMGLFLNLKMLYECGVIAKNADGSYKLYDDAGMPLYPTTFDDIERISRIIVDNYDDTYGLIVLSADKNGGWQLSNFSWNFSGEPLQIVNEDGTVTANLDGKGTVDALSWIQKMRNEGLVYPDASSSYQNWHQKIGNNKVAMAFTGSDAIALPVNSYGFNKDDIAFVPMPTGDGEHRYSLYGGTPFCISYKASEEQVRGALLFLEYMGYSPEVSEISLRGMRQGRETARAKAMPILPAIRPWKNQDYLAEVQKLDDEFINVNMAYYRDFFDTIQERKHAEEPYFTQNMYKFLDEAIQGVLSNAATANVQSLLKTANDQFQSMYLDKVR